MSRSSTAAAELKVRKLAKLPCNTSCPNCGTQQKHGFSTVCIKFHTFVCNNCKSSHQAISHRCKSLTMSSWTMEEVDELERKGNEYCRNTWLKHAPECGQNGRPCPSSHIAIFKSFVVNAYERKQYYGQDREGSESVAVAAPSGAALKPTSSSATPRRVKAPTVTATAAPVADLLDFSAPTTTTTTTTTTVTDHSFAADFGDFQTASSATPALAQKAFPALSSSSSIATTTTTPTLLAPPPSSFPVAPSKLAPPPSSTYSLSMFDGMSNNNSTTATMNGGSTTTASMPVMMNSNGGGVNNHISMMNNSNSMMDPMGMNGMNGFPSNSSFQSPNPMAMNNSGRMNQQQQQQSNGMANNTGMMMMNTGIGFSQNGMAGFAAANQNGIHAFSNGGMSSMNHTTMQQPQMNMQPQQPMMYHAQGMQATMSMNQNFGTNGGNGNATTTNNNNKDDPFAGLGGF